MAGQRGRSTGPSTHASPPAVSPAAGDPRSTGEILKDVVSETQTLFRKELELAKLEIAEGMKVRAQAMALVIVGGLFALYALGFLGVTIAVALQNLMSPWLSWALVFAGYLLVAVLAMLVARSRATSAPVTPEETKRSIEETKTWATQQLRR